MGGEVSGKQWDEGAGRESNVDSIVQDGDFRKDSAKSLLILGTL
jgi:hypothetical protein